MALRRTAIRQFSLANNAYRNASVSFYEVDPTTKARTSTLATIFTGPTGTTQAANPYTLDSTGKFATPLYTEEPVIAVVTQASVSAHETGIIWPDYGGYRGAWAANEEYMPGEFVRDESAGANTGNIYICLAQHTSGTWATDLSNSYWALAIPANIVTLPSGVTGILDIAHGGTNSSTASQARSNLGLAIGSDVQAYNANLQAVQGYVAFSNATPGTAPSAASGTDSFAFGSGALVATGTRAIAIGLSRATGTDSLAMNIGSNAVDYGASGLHSTALGYVNLASGSLSTVIGGQANIASANLATIIGSNGSTVSTELGMILGGSANLVSGGTGSIAIGGIANQVIETAGYAAIVGGTGHTISGTASYSAVVGGTNGTIDDGGFNTIVGGSGNSAVGGSTYSGLVGGTSNTITNGARCAIIGGTANDIATGANNCSIIASSSSDVLSNVSYAVIIGGQASSVNQDHAVCLGDGSVGTGDGGTFIAGRGNSASGKGSLALGYGNDATVSTGSWGAICLGIGNDSNSNGATSVGFGNVSSAEGASAFGYGNTASAEGAFAAGKSNTASGVESVAIGLSNTASGPYSSARGRAAQATHHGEDAYMADGFSAIGDAQTMTLRARRITTTSTPAELFLDGSSLRATIPSNSSWTFVALVNGVRTDSGSEAAAYVFAGGIKNIGGTTALIGSVTPLHSSEDTAGWDCAITADNTNDALIATVTGENSKTIRWTVTFIMTQTKF